MTSVNKVADEVESRDREEEAEGSTSSSVVAGSGDEGISTKGNQLRNDLCTAAWNGVMEELKRLVKIEGCSVSQPADSGRYALHWAAGNNQTVAAQYIIANGGDVNAADHAGQTALHWSAVSGAILVAELLLREGARVDATDVDGYQAVHVAAFHGQSTFLSRITEKGSAHPDVPDKDGRSPLHWAAFEGQIDCIRVLLTFHADSRRQDSQGRTPLHCAARMGRLEACKVLVEAGKKEDLMLTDNNGCTPAQLAVKHNHSEVAFYLIAKNTDLEELQEPCSEHRFAVGCKSECDKLSSEYASGHGSEYGQKKESVSSESVIPSNRRGEDGSVRPSYRSDEDGSVKPSYHEGEEKGESHGGDGGYDHMANLQVIKNADLEELRELGSGAFGTVSLGKWRGTDVAIKRINERCYVEKNSEKQRLRVDLVNEANKLAELSHPNVVAFYGVVLDGPRESVAIVTEYMVHGSLRTALEQNKRDLDGRKRLLIAMDVAFGMEYLHSKNIVHFDLKSDNLLVNLSIPDKPVCKVGDLGLSKVKCKTLITGGVRGTLPWMAPELLNGRSCRVSEKVDVFSFGIVLWELLTGEEPYVGLHYWKFMGGILRNTQGPPVPDNCDPDWRSLMERCWLFEPSKRPNFTEIAKELRAMEAKIPSKGQTATTSSGTKASLVVEALSSPYYFF